MSKLHPLSPSLPKPQFRIHLSSEQLSLLSSITKNPVLKRRMISSTVSYPKNSVVRLGGELYTIEKPLGSGLVAVGYLAIHQETGAQVVLKIPRGRFGFFKESIRIESEVIQVLESLQSLVPASLIFGESRGLVKKFYAQETLSRSLSRGVVSVRQKEALLDVLREAFQVYLNYGFILDLSPKNLVWDNQWILLDGGPKIHKTDFLKLLESPDWNRYVHYFLPKLEKGQSQPSVLSGSVVSKPIRADRVVFVGDWWEWFPYDLDLDRDYFFVEIDEQIIESGMLLQAELETGQVRILPGASRRLIRNPLIFDCAFKSFSNLFSESILKNPNPVELKRAPEWDDVEGIDKKWDHKNPLSLKMLAAESGPYKGGKLLRKLVDCEQIPRPTLRVREYGHWSDIIEKPNEYQPTDLYCHQPLEFITKSSIAWKTFEKKAFRVSPVVREGAICELTCFPAGSSSRAILLVPGFRAPQRAMFPLVKILMNEGVKGLFCLCRVGVNNNDDQPLVTSGRWETPLLWSAIDFITDGLGAKEVVVISASHGTIASLLVSELHPDVSTLIMDSPVKYPLRILEVFQKLRGKTLSELLPKLRECHLPEEFELELPAQKNLRILTMRPKAKDQFLEFCGDLQAENSFLYDGPHAATMRHDSDSRGIPNKCIEKIVNFLM